jgi:hypothetical protein
MVSCGKKDRLLSGGVSTHQLVEREGGEGECKEISVSLGTLSWELNPMTNAFD